MDILFKTLHGSHLYGLAHEGSDFDFYTVVRRDRHRRGTRYKYAKQTIVEDVDTTTVDMGTWFRLCAKGVPQALEAMFAPNPLVDNFPALRAAYRAGGEVRSTYARTIVNFIHDSNFKKRRHALRLALNLRDIGRYGRFNPTLTQWQIRLVDSLARIQDEEKLLDLAFNMAYSDMLFPIRKEF